MTIYHFLYLLFKANIGLVGDMLRHLFTFSMANGVVPYNMIIAKVKCIYKSGDPKHVSNYRPISVLPVLSKILETYSHATIKPLSSVQSPV